ncbi:unnamed protein product [Microthlaspi erraticum]|uniref:PUM-HD domain-containing protein n=1 Tax=Microthlaspi erraticum TaxID=1685480 RepID=A0A6D2J2X1_9BRAS|nr:unnamed protein product [Microthlaspi erraticum]
MESIYDDNSEAQTRWCHRVMTSSEKFYEDEFLRILSASYDLKKFANTLTSDSDNLVEIISDEAGLDRVMRILGISDDINTILFQTIMARFPATMTLKSGKALASRLLDVCNIDQKNTFCQSTYRHALLLARDENGCSTLKKAITIADDILKSDFLELISLKAHFLSEDDLGISLIQHVLNLDYTRKATEDDTLLHELFAEFDEILPTCDTVELLNLASKLTSDSRLFLEFVKTKRGLLMVQIILGRSEEVDRVFWEAIRRGYTDLAITHHGHRIMLRTINVFEKRGNKNVYAQILRLVGYNAFYLSKQPIMGNAAVLHAINIHNPNCTEFIACGLQCHYIELSFLNNGSNIVEKLLGEVDEDNNKLPILFMVVEIVNCDEDTLVRLAKDEYGNRVLEKTLHVADYHHLYDLVDDIVDKLEPLLDTLRGSRGENIAALSSRPV